MEISFENKCQILLVANQIVGQTKEGSHEQKVEAVLELYDKLLAYLTKSKDS